MQPRLPHPVLRQIAYLFLAFFFSLFVIACTPPAQAKVSCDVNSQVSEGVNPLNLDKSSSINAAIMVDGTLSMQGYVTLGTSTQYGKALQLLDSISSTAWAGTGSTVKYFRFGTKQQEINRQGFRQSLTPGFYRVEKGLEVAEIDKLIRTPKDNDLTFIVTDLYQKDADIALVQGAINKNYLRNGYAIGVLALRSEFKGNVYDVGTANQNFAYDTTRLKPDKYHPFYILILGKYGNIRYFYNQMRNADSSLMKQSQFVIFYSQPTLSTATLTTESLPEPLPVGIKRTKALNDGKVVARAETPGTVDFLSIDRKKDELSPVEYGLKLDLLPHSLSINQGLLALSSEAHKYNKPNGFTPMSDRPVNIDSWSLDNNLIKVETNFKTKLLDTEVTTYTAQFIPTGLETPAWWEKWSALDNQMDGSRTNNLLRFMQDLQRSSVTLMKQQGTPIAKLCLAIQGK